MPANVLVAYGTTNAQAGGGDGRPMCRGPACAEGESGRFAKGGIHHVGHPREARPRRTPPGPRRLPRALAAQQPALVLRRGGPRPRVRAACGRRATDDPYRPGRQGDRDRLRRRSVQRADSRTTPRLPARRCGPPPERARARPRRARAASRRTPRAAARRAVGPPRRRSRVRCPPGSGRRHRRSRRRRGAGTVVGERAGDQDHRPGGVRGQDRRGRTHGHSGVPALAAQADHKQLCAVARGAQDRTRCPGQDLPRTVNAG